MQKLLIVATFLIALAGCGKEDHGTPPPEFQTTQPTDTVPLITPQKETTDTDLRSELDEAESAATPDGLRILQTGRMMIQDNVIVVGSCWDFINAVFTRAGYPGKSTTAVFTSKLAGPFADVTTIQPGDWLYFINHSYGDVEHSGVFLMWMDPEQKIALVMSYVGGNNPVTGRYSTYELSNVYNILRPKTGMAAKLPVNVTTTPTPTATPAPTP